MFCRIAYNKLKKELGALDSYIELSELAHRDFVLHGNNHQNFARYISEKSELHGIIVNNKTADQLRQIFVGNYIAMTYNLFELFFSHFQEEYNRFSPDRLEYHLSEKGGSSTTKFHYLMSYFVNSKGRISQNHVNLYLYFREVRIHTTHPGSKKDKIDDQYQKITLDSDEVLKNKKKKEFKLDKLPNEYEKLTFDDWLLFTKLVKYLAFEISKNTIPSPDNLIKHYPQLKRLKNRSSFEKRREKARRILGSDFKIEEDFLFYDKIEELL